MNARFLQVRAAARHSHRSARMISGASTALVLALLLRAAPVHSLPSCPANLDRATPDSDLIDNGNATVTHLPTGLTWKQCSEGYSGAYCTGVATGGNTWAQAQAAATAANSAKFAGYDDWRLPSYKELESIVETGCQTPSINWTRFPGTNAQYWTSTSYGSAPAAWYVSFQNGAASVSDKASKFDVRLVRGGRAFGAVDVTNLGTKSKSAPSPTGTGTISASLSGGGAGCGFAYAQFILPEAPLPTGATLPHGQFDFSVFGCTTASTVTVTLVYPATLPTGSVLWKYGRTAANTTPHWYIFPATIAGSQVQYTITDGQAGDDDLAANGHITDPAGVGTDRIFANGFQ